MHRSSFPPELRRFVNSVEKNARAAGHPDARARIYGAWSACFVRFCTVHDESWRVIDSVPPFLDYLDNRDDVDAASREKAAESMVFLFEELLKTSVEGVEWHPDRQAESTEESVPDDASDDSADGDQSALLTRLLFHTSLPINEALELCAGDVDLDAGLIYVSDPMGTPKQIIELPDTLHDPLRQHLRDLRKKHGRQYFDAPLFQARALQGRKQSPDEASAPADDETEEDTEPVTAQQPDDASDSDGPASLWGYAENAE